MSDVKRLLAEATPLPWTGSRWLHHYGYGFFHDPVPPAQGRGITSGDAALIVYAVNCLPDYEAAVEALEAVTDLLALRIPDRGDGDDTGFDDEHEVIDEARAALARLRESVPA